MFGITDLLYNFLNWINSWVGAWGWAIVVFTVMVRLVLTPLDIKSRAGMRKTQKLQPQLAALQKKYANDKEKLNQKTAELYRKAHVNPLSSCLPLLLTWPILIAVFGAMRTAANKEILNQMGQILNGQQPVMENWLWIRNLWMPDNPFYSALPDFNTLRTISAGEWQNWFNSLGGVLPAQMQNVSMEWIESLNADVLKNIPVALREMVAANGFTADCFSDANLQGSILLLVEKMNTMSFYTAGIANIPGYTIPLVNWTVKSMYNGFLLLPILSAVSQIAMTKIMGSGTPQPAEGQPNTGKFMQWFFPLFSLWICIGYSSAFALYWVAGNLVSMGQTWIINKYLDKKEQMAAPVAGEGSVK
jgi:YidC/Oxa1 family membrane protein insertase